MSHSNELIEKIVGVTLRATFAILQSGEVNMRELGKALRPALAEALADEVVGPKGDPRQLVMSLGEATAAESGEVSHG